MAEQPPSPPGPVSPVVLDPAQSGAAPSGAAPSGPVPSGAPSPAVLADLSGSAVVHVRCTPEPLGAAALRVEPGRAVGRGDGLAVGVRPGEWFVLSAPGTAARTVADVEGRLAAAAREGALVTVLDVTHGRAVLRLGGDGAADVLTRLTTVDLRDRAVPNGSAVRTGVAGAVVDVVRVDAPAPDGGPQRRSYLLLTDRDCGQYLADRLLAAGASPG